MRVLIAADPEFLCAGKFQRKCRQILSRLDNFEVTLYGIQSDVVGDFFLEDERVKSCSWVTGKMAWGDASHAIVFDDGISMNGEVDELQRAGVTVRRIVSPITRVVNIDKGSSYDVYIGRGTEWGNPYAIGPDGDRNEVIRKFEYDFCRDYLREGNDFKKKLLTIRGARLGCHCKPAPCHGDILARYLNEMDEGN